MARTDAISQDGPVWAAHLLLLSALVPYYFQAGPVLLMPHRVVIMVLFLPFFFKLFVLRHAGPVLAIDWLLLAASLWAGVALLANHPIGFITEPFGVHLIEFFGGYLIARVAIRSGEGFRRFVRLLFLVALVLLPFAALESITQRPVLLNLLPSPDVAPTNSGVRLGMRRAQTVFVHPIHFGVFMSTGFGLYWYALRPRWLRLPGALVAAVGTVFSLSTGALLSIVMQSIFIGWEMVLKMLRWRWTLFIILAILGYALIDILSNRTPFHVLVTYATFSTTSSYNRIIIWEHGMNNVWQNPVFGLGYNDWVRPTWLKASVDNFWLLVTMRYGLPFAIMFITALVLILRRVSRAVLSNSEDRMVRSAYLVAFGGICFAGATVHYWHSMQAFVMLVFGSGIWIISGGGAAADTVPPEDREPQQRLSRYTRQTAVNTPIGAGGLSARARPASPGPQADQPTPRRRVSRTSA